MIADCGLRLADLIVRASLRGGVLRGSLIVRASLRGGVLRGSETLTIYTYED